MQRSQAVRGVLEGEEFVVAVSGESITFGLFCLRPRRQSEIGYPSADTGEDKGEYECAAESGGVAFLGVGGHEAQLESEHGPGHGRCAASNQANGAQHPGRQAEGCGRC